MVVSTFLFTERECDKVTSKYNCTVLTESGGRCTGSAYCRACTNCSRCGHCNSGGSCGVCGDGSNQTYSSPKKTKKSFSNYYTSTREISKEYYENETIYISNEVINLRSGPGLNYEIIEQIYSGDPVTFIEKEGEWIKVKVSDTGSIGYLYAKLLK